jgi:hypothetical protein
MSRWFRHYAGMMRDDKLVRVAIRSKQTIERVAWVWGAILESAAEIDDDGRYDFDAAEAAYFLRADEDDVAAIVAALGVSGRLSGDHVAKWGDRQFKSDRAAERQARYRERKRAGDAEVEQAATSGEPNGDRPVTSLSRHGDAPETETETETDNSEPKGSSPRAWTLPAGVSLQVWTDFLSNRKRKRLGNTPTAWRSFQDDLARVSLMTGIPPPRLIEQCTAKGWGAIYDPREKANERSNNPLRDAVSRIVANG